MRKRNNAKVEFVMTDVSALTSVFAFPICIQFCFYETFFLKQISCYSLLQLGPEIRFSIIPVNIIRWSSILHSNYLLPREVWRS